MKKIRNFKLHLHFKETRRRARRKFDLASLGLGDEQWANLLSAVEERMKPAVVYETFRAESADTAGLAPIPGLAHTLGLATLGPGPASLLEEAGRDSEEMRRLYELILASGLEQAVQFVIMLLRKDVEAERCELSALAHITEYEPLERLFNKLEGGKIDVALTQAGLHPAQSTAFCLSWISQPRRGGAKPQAPAAVKRRR